MRQVLVLRQVPHETMGTVGAALSSAQLRYRHIDLFDGVPDRLDWPQAAGLIVLGGPMNVDETDKYPFLAREIDWIGQAIDARLPVLGICLGSQLLAKTLGARVFPNGVKEIGWYSVDLTAEAAADRLFGAELSGLMGRTSFSPQPAGGGQAGRGEKGDSRQTGTPSVAEGRLTVFQWHGDTFDLPAGAVQLARGRQCEQQAFRYGEAAFGLQFHVEVTAEMIDDWLSQAENCRELSGLPYIDPQQIRRQTPCELPAMQALGSRVFGRFAALCAKWAFQA